MARKRILVVEDDAPIRKGIADALTFGGYEVLEAGNGRTGLDKALTGSYELMLLDLVLPGGDGFEILRQTRQSHPSVPVIILTARGEENDRVRGLKMGADDYVVKPFSIKELLARIEAVLRRTPERPSGLDDIVFPGGKVNCDEGIIDYEDGSQDTIATKELDLLRHLAANAGRVVTRDEILYRVWGLKPGSVHTRTIDIHVARLRQKLKDDPDSPRILKTVRGKGYMFNKSED